MESAQQAWGLIQCHKSLTLQENNNVVFLCNSTQEEQFLKKCAPPAAFTSQVKKFVRCKEVTMPASQQNWGKYVCLNKPLTSQEKHNVVFLCNPSQLASYIQHCKVAPALPITTAVPQPKTTKAPQPIPPPVVKPVVQPQLKGGVGPGGIICDGGSVACGLRCYPPSQASQCRGGKYGSIWLFGGGGCVYDAYSAWPGGWLFCRANGQATLLAPFTYGITCKSWFPRLLADDTWLYQYQPITGCK